MTNFSFMENETNLYSIIRSAEDNLFLDPDTCLYKLRKYINELVKKILQINNIFFDDEHSLAELISILEKNNLFSGKSIDKMHQIRMAGNSSVHDNLFSNQVAEKMLVKAFDISNEYVLRYVNPAFELQRYVYWEYGNAVANTEDKNSICTKNEAEFYNQAIAFLDMSVQKYIINKKLDGWGSIIEIKYLSYAEYYDYYKSTIQELVDESREAMMLIIHLKDFIVNKTFLQRGEQCDREIALRLYVRTPWGRKYEK